MTQGLLPKFCPATYLPLRTLAVLVGVVVSLWAAPLFASPAHSEEQEEAPTALPDDDKRLPTYKLGEFVIKNFRPVEQEQFIIRLTVHAEVSRENKAEFEALWPRYQHRLRSQIITATRILAPHEFDDPQLAALRRRIFLRLRRVLPELPIEQIYVSDFSYLVE